jgi:hypothetical protein
MNPPTLKAWKIDEAARHGVTPSAIQMRLKRGRYPGISLLRLNPRLVFVFNRVAYKSAKSGEVGIEYAELNTIRDTIGLRLAATL